MIVCSNPITCRYKTFIGFQLKYIFFLSNSRRKCNTTNNNNKSMSTGLETCSTPHLSHQTPDYQNVSNPANVAETETYMGFKTSRQPESVYQGMTNPEQLKSSDNYQSLDTTNVSNADAEYQSLSKDKRQDDQKRGQDLIYHDISENKYENTVCVKTDEQSAYSNVSKS